MSNFGRIIVSLIAVVLLTAATGCTRTQQSYPPRALGAKSTPSLDAVTSAILRAGRRQSWNMTVMRPGLIEAKREWGRGGKHNIVLNVVYSQSDYSINYVSSKNLKAGDGTIHRAYNRETTNLYDQIRVETSKL